MAKSFKEYPTLLENPFQLSGIVTKHITNNKSEVLRTLVDSESGEIMNVVGLQETAKEMIIDTLEFTKVFKQAIPDMQKINVAGLKTWTYIIYHMKPNRDYILINPEDCRDWCKYSQINQVYRGLVNLMENSFIAKGKHNLFWINPNYFYNGRRQLNKTYN